VQREIALQPRREGIQNRPDHLRVQVLVLDLRARRVEADFGDDRQIIGPGGEIDRVDRIFGGDGALGNGEKARGEAVIDLVILADLVLLVDDRGQTVASQIGSAPLQFENTFLTGLELIETDALQDLGRAGLRLAQARIGGFE